MIRLTVISVGSLKESYLSAAVAEYEKRLSAFCRIENIELKEARIRNEDDESEIAAALEDEGTRILARIPEGAVTFALCVEGRAYDSIELSRLLGDAADQSGKLCLVIGSSHGLSERVKAACRHRLSLSRLTFPHQLLRVILLESVYRSFMIRAGKSYHK